MKRHLAVIPARGGSKRLPRKNIIGFLGKPIIAYTIEAAKASGVFDRILVSTEDSAIAEVAARHGGEVDMRPASLATDASTITEVCLELIGRLKTNGESFATLTVLYATAPLRNAGDIRATHALLGDGCDFAMAVTEFHQPVHQALVLKPAQKIEPVFPELISKRASDVDRYAAGNGSTYCVNISAFKTKHGFYGVPLRGHVMPRERSIDIDTKEDFELAEYYAKQQKS
ncbi:MAG: acylneuraminate cytidylyltransferase family protein [Xanthobacteraceae bacterium]|nr:acylneuraminate cytidylyltransferase family protein [Xanthobacteraceae bacterium]